MSTSSENTPARSDLWVERAGPRQYIAHNGRGGRVLIDGGDGDEAFTPGELLKLALAACTGLSSDVSLARRLGDDFSATIHAEGAAGKDRERYTNITERFEIDFSDLEDEARDRLVALAARTVESKCTVGRTLKHGADVHLDIADTSTGSVVFHTSTVAHEL